MFEKFSLTGSVLFLSGINDSHGGNISIREDEKIFITSRSAMPGHMKQGDIIETGLSDGDERDSSASRDTGIHRAIYNNTNAKAIIHAHGPNMMTLSLNENKIFAQDAKGLHYFPQGISVIKARQGASKDELIRMIVPMLSSVPGVSVIKGYGCFVYASSLDEALEITTALEMSSKIWLSLKLLTPKQPQPQQQTHSYEHRKRSAIPPSIGVMGRRTGNYGRDSKR